jgi:hypothetical protein
LELLQKIAQALVVYPGDFCEHPKSGLRHPAGEVVEEKQEVVFDLAKNNSGRVETDVQRLGVCPHHGEERIDGK